MARLKNHCKLDFSADGVYLNILLDKFHAYPRVSNSVKRLAKVTDHCIKRKLLYCISYLNAHLKLQAICQCITIWSFPIWSICIQISTLILTCVDFTSCCAYNQKSN